ncbi:MAG TPA: tetratricopeptide repeat protein [Verrucomicrobiales bacterium]|nr:tetratricopeptide repeat protein [Verrucomicrobiales bacterium]
MNRPLFATALVYGLSAVAWSPFAAGAPPAAASAPATTVQPSTSDTYLQGYLTMVEGDKQRKNGDFAGAYFKYRDARDTFDAVHAAEPAWNAEIIDYRRRKIREAMEEVRKLEMERRAAGGEISSSGILGSALGPDPKNQIGTPMDIPPTDESRPPKAPSTLMEERMKGLYEQITRLERKNEAILKTLGAKEEELRNASKARLESKASEDAMRARLVEAETKLETSDAAEKRKHQALIKKVDELQSALNLANEKLNAANAERDKMATDLANAIGEIKRLNTEVTGLRKERDQMVNLLTGADSKGPDKLKMFEENQRLTKELAAAQQKISQLSKEKDTDRSEIVALKEQVRSVQDSLDGMKQENEDYRRQIATLTGKLDATRKQLAETGGAGAVTESEAIAENNVLREIILQQLKQQARRERARQNIMDELTREGVFDKMKELGVESENILRSVNEMAAPIMLSKDQRDIIASTQVDKLLTGPDGKGLKELSIVDDSADDKPPGDAPPDSTGAADKAGLSTELKAYANAAEEHFSSGDYTSAENDFRKILLVEPQNVYALCNLGVTQIRLNNNEEAAETLLKALAYNYDDDFAHYVRGVALLRTARLDDAVEEIELGLKLNGKNASAWHTLGLISIKRGQREQAKAHFLKAVALDANCSEAHYNLAVIFASSGDPAQFDTARKHYKLAIKAGAARDTNLDKLLGMR